ncbi:MAG: MarR family winged helix-turn-helix transcriptional regulator [Deferribacterales bacterium]
MDAVDRIIQQWKDEGITESLAPMELLGRMTRLYTLLSKLLEENFAKFGLTRWEFDVLATLRRSGEPYCLSPTKLFDTLMVTSGTMTNRLTHLEKRGLVKRIKDSSDKRSLPVQLTDTGFETVTMCLKAHIEEEARITGGLTGEQIDSLNSLLKAFEQKLPE